MNKDVQVQGSDTTGAEYTYSAGPQNLYFKKCLFAKNTTTSVTAPEPKKL